MFSLGHCRDQQAGQADRPHATATPQGGLDFKRTPPVLIVGGQPLIVNLRCYLAWCAERGLDPLAAQRPRLELHIRWMQEVRRFRPSTVSRRFSVAAGFYRPCVLDGVLPHSPAEHVRRPSVPAESLTSGFTHLQFEALLTAARESANPCDFALAAMPGLLGLRIFEATSADIADPVRSTDTGYCGCAAREPRPNASVRIPPDNQ
jgi:hypothetical protein